MKAIIGQKLFPGLLDVYLGKTSYKAQQREEPDSTDRPNNVWHPVSTTLGAHGPFDGKSRTFSLEAEMSKHCSWFVLGCGLLAAALCAKKLLPR